MALGGAFHSGRLRIQSSQVGTVAGARRGRRSYAERRELALDLLRDPVFDALHDGTSPFEELPAVLAVIAAGGGPVLSHVVTYGQEA